MKTHTSEITPGQLCHETRAMPTSLLLRDEGVSNIDRLRILAALGIVWFHTEGAPGRQIAYAALPAFLLIFVSLVTRKGVTTTTTQFLRRRCNRLLVPWLFWSAIYGLCRLAKAVLTTDLISLRELFSAETLFVGTSIHLWYLPYAFASGLLIYEFNRWTSKATIPPSRWLPPSPGDWRWPPMLQKCLLTS